jgi:serine protease AprX
MEWSSERKSAVAETVSTTHTDEFLRRERQAVERLSAEMGREVVAKFDRLLLRDLIYERKEREIGEVLGEGAVAEGQRYRVMINMRTGRQQQVATMRPPTRRQRRHHIAELQKSGQLALRRLEADLEQLGAEVLQSFWLTNSVAADLTSEQLERIATREDIASVTAVKRRFATCLDVSRPLIQADQVENNLGFDGTGITVAVLDTGVDATHPALAGVVTSQQDFTGASGNPAEGTGDLNGHGTHCAGVVASQDATRRGIAPGANIADIKIMDVNGTTDQVIAVAGITAAVTLGVNVASNSWGFTHADGNWTDPPAPGQPDGTCVLCTAADNAVNAGVVFVVAAGNEDNDTCATYDTHIRCPGLARLATTVGASDDSDNMAGFSSIGPTPDGRAKPDVVAPGVEIGSARASGTSMGSPIDANWTNSDGTSMACPHVAGVAALILDKNGAVTPANVKSTLMATAVNIGATANEMGSGRVDALAAVNRTPAPPG